MLRQLHRRRRAMAEASGQGLTEYALLLALIAVVAIAALLFLGNSISSILNTIGSTAPFS